MYPNYPYFAVAITRTCGSGGGSYIGKKLAKDFDIDLYDRKLLRRTLAEDFSPACPRLLLEENPRRILEDRPLVGTDEPIFSPREDEL